MFLSLLFFSDSRVLSALQEYGKTNLLPSVCLDLKTSIKLYRMHKAAASNPCFKECNLFAFVNNLIFKEIKNTLKSLSLHIYTVHIQISLHCEAMVKAEKQSALIQNSAAIPPPLWAQHLPCPSRNTSPFITWTTSLVLDHLDSFSAVVVIAVGRCHCCESCDAPLGKREEFL